MMPAVFLRRDSQFIFFIRPTVTDGRYKIRIVRRVNNRADWDLHDFRQCRAPMHFFSPPMCAILRLRDRFVEESGQIVGVQIGAKNDVSAATAIAAVWSAPGHKFLATKADAAATAVAGLCENFYAVNKHL